MMAKQCRNSEAARRNALSLALRGSGALVGASFLSGLGGCMTAPPLQRKQSDLGTTLAQPVKLQLISSKLGEAFEFQVRNVFNNEIAAKELHRLEANATVARLLNGEKTLPACVYNADGRLLVESHYGQAIEFEQACPLFPTQAGLGGKEVFRTSFRVTTPDNPASARQTPFTYDWYQQCAFMGQESIKVPAGEFDTLRFERQIFFRHQDSFRQESTRLDTMWYSPKLGYWVAREWTGSYYLPGRRRGGRMREDWLRWELVRALQAPVS